MKFTSLLAMIAILTLIATAAFAASPAPERIEKAKAIHLQKKGLEIKPENKVKLEQKLDACKKACQRKAERYSQRGVAKARYCEKARRLGAPMPYAGYSTYRVNKHIAGMAAAKAQHRAARQACTCECRGKDCLCGTQGCTMNAKCKHTQDAREKCCTQKADATHQCGK